MRSAEHLRTLFYDKLQYPVQVWTDNELDPKPGTDEDARKGWGPAGKLLITYGTLEKLRSSVVSLLEKLDSTGRYHPELRAPGTHTGRLSGGGGYNWQNAPKCKEILDELMTYVIDEDGTTNASEGPKDDLVIGTALAVQGYLESEHYSLPEAPRVKDGTPQSFVDKVLKAQETTHARYDGERKRY